MLARVSFENEVGDLAVGALIDKLVNEGETMVIGKEGDGWLAAKSLKVEPRPISVNIGEVGDD